MGSSKSAALDESIVANRSLLSVSLNESSLFPLDSIDNFPPRLDALSLSYKWRQVRSSLKCALLSSRLQYGLPKQ